MALKIANALIFKNKVFFIHGLDPVSKLLNTRFRCFNVKLIKVSLDFGGGSCSSCCYSCDRGKTKSTPCPTLTELLSLNWSLTKRKYSQYEYPLPNNVEKIYNEKI